MCQAMAALLVVATLTACSTDSVDKDAARLDREYEDEERRQSERESRQMEREFYDEQNRDTVQSTLEFWDGSDHSDEPPDPRPGAIDKCLPSPKYSIGVLLGCGRVSRVAEVVDGDTLRLRRGQLVRLVGIDAPEVYPGAECGGREATRFLTTLLRAGSATAGTGWVRCQRLSSLPLFRFTLTGTSSAGFYGRWRYSGGGPTKATRTVWCASTTMRTRITRRRRRIEKA